ncbi:MAG TPA: putative porin, partial [Cellvibrio sp.]|nr:putative porin [Cellvibrio sp.]
QAEVIAGLTRVDMDYARDEMDVYTLGGKYYFEKVETANLPIAESAFLNKNGGVYAIASRADFPGEDYESYTVGADYFIPDAFLYFDVSADQAKYGSDTDNDWGTTLGVTPIEGLLISTEYYHDQGYDANLSAKYVTATGAGEFINIEAQVVDGDDEGEETYTSVGADYYFDRTFSVGGQLENVDSDNSYTIRTHKFFTEQFNAGLAYTDAPDGHTISVAVGLHF